MVHKYSLIDKTKQIELRALCCDLLSDVGRELFYVSQPHPGILGQLHFHIHEHEIEEVKLKCVLLW